MATVRRICRPSCELSVAYPKASTERRTISVKKPRSVAVLAVPRPLTWQSLRLILLGPIDGLKQTGIRLRAEFGPWAPRRLAATEYSVRYIDCYPPPTGWDWAAKAGKQLSAVCRAGKQLWPRRLPIPRRGILLSRCWATTRQRRKPFTTERFRRLERPVPEGCEFGSEGEARGFSIFGVGGLSLSKLLGSTSGRLFAIDLAHSQR